MAGGNGVNRAMETLRKYQKEMLEIRMMKPRPDKAEGRGRETPKLLCREKRVGGGAAYKSHPCVGGKAEEERKTRSKGNHRSPNSRETSKRGPDMNRRSGKLRESTRLDQMPQSLCRGTSGVQTAERPRGNPEGTTGKSSDRQPGPTYPTDWVSGTTRARSGWDSTCKGLKKQRARAHTHTCTH